MLVYFASNTEERINLNGIITDKVYLAWFDPKDGSLTETVSRALSDPDGFLSVQNSLKEDQVLILADDAGKIAVPQGVYGESGTEEEARKVFEW